MGLCPIFGNKPAEQVKPRPPIQQEEIKTTERAIVKIPQPNKEQHRRNNNSKKTNEEQSVNSNNTTQNNNFNKNFSSTYFSAISDRKTSSLLSRGIFDSDSIILKRRDSSPRLHSSKEQEYVLIDSIYSVKKGNSNFKVISPYNQYFLKCSPNKILPTYYLTEGIPRQSLSQIILKQDNIIKPIFKATESPIQTKITLACKKCSIKAPTQTPRKVKFTFSTSVIKPLQIVCDQCQTQGEWSLINIQTNYPVWAGDKKISKKRSQKFQAMENLPELMRIMGCVDCFCYPIKKNYQQLICGCIVCSACNQTRLTQNRNQCEFCEG